MDKYNIVFIKTENGEKEMLGRRAEDYVLREFADFSAKKCRIAKTEAYKEENALLDGCVNVVLTLDMPLVKKKDIEMLVRQMKQKNISLIRLGAKDSLAKICIGKGVDEGVFCKQDAFLKIDVSQIMNHRLEEAEFSYTFDPEHTDVECAALPEDIVIPSGGISVVGRVKNSLGCMMFESHVTVSRFAQSRVKVRY